MKNMHFILIIALFYKLEKNFFILDQCDEFVIIVIVRDFCIFLYQKYIIMESKKVIIINLN